MDIFDSYLKEVSADLPCGPFIDDDDDLENEFITLEGQARINQESLASNDDSNEAVDWRGFYSSCEDMIGKTKDVRVYVYLVQSALKVKKWSGFASAINLVKQVLDEYWDEVYPELDDANDEAPWRIMCLNELSGDTVNTLMHSVPLVESRLAGVYSMRDIKLAKGMITPVDGSEETIPDLAIIQGAFTETSDDELTATLELIKGTLENVQAMETKLAGSNCSHVKFAWDTLKTNLAFIRDTYQEHLPDTAADNAGVVEGETELDAGDAPVAVAAASAAPVQIPGKVSNRNDVLKRLDEICEYYTKHEPSSPVPMLLERAKKLVTMDFMAILKDMSPKGVSQAALIMGLELDDDDDDDDDY